MDRRLDLARELESQDAALGERLERLERLGREVDRIRARASELEAFLEQLPAEGERTRGQLATLAREAEEAQAEAAGLAEAADAVARELEAEPRVTLAAPAGEGLAGVLDWAARARAAILVARSGLDVERDRIFREANELGASVLGESLQAANVSLVRRRVEERLGSQSN